MTEQLEERMGILLAGMWAEKRKRSRLRYGRRHSELRFKRNRDWSGVMIRRLEFGKTKWSRPVGTNDVSDNPITVRSLAGHSYRKWVKTPAITSRERILDKLCGSHRPKFISACSATNNDSGRELESEVPSIPQSTQKSTLLLPKILQISDVLKLSEDTKIMIALFLEYLDKEYNYEWKTDSLLQAFQLSVCWLAVSFLKQEIDREESLATVKEQLDFTCEEAEADYIYSLLQNLDEGFKDYLKSVEPVDLEVDEILTGVDEAEVSERTACYEQDLEVDEIMTGVDEAEVSEGTACYEQDLEDREAQLSSNNSRKSKSLPSERSGRYLKICFESRYLSDQLAGMEAAERPMISNCAMNSRSNTLCGVYLEEEVMSMSSDRRKKSKLSILVEQECEGELPNCSENQILSAQLMTSEGGDTPVGTSDGQYQEEEEIQLDSNGTNNSKMVTPVLQDLEEGGIPIGSEKHSLSDRVVNSEEGEKANSFQRSIKSGGSIKVKMDDASCQIELHVKNLKTAAPRIVEKQPEASRTVQLKKTLDKPIVSLERLQLSDTELKVNNMLPTAAIEVHSDSDDDIQTFSSPTNQNHCVTVPTMPSATPVISPLATGFCNSISGEKTIIVESNTERKTMEATIAKEGESCPLQQLPISTVPLTAEQRLHVEPQFIGYQSGQTQSSSQETQIPRHVSFEDSTESRMPSTAQGSLQPLTSIREGGNETVVQNASRRIHVHGFRNAANRVRSQNGHLFYSHGRPEIPEHTSSDPLQIEMQRIANDAAKDDKAHQDLVLQLTSERDEEVRKVLQKYCPLIQSAEIAREKRIKEHKANFLKAYAHRSLAQVMAMNANRQMADLAKWKELMRHPSVYAPAIHGSPMMPCMPRNLQIGNELRAISPSPAPHVLQAAFRSHSSALATNHPSINNLDI